MLYDGFETNDNYCQYSNIPDNECDKPRIGDINDYSGNEFGTWVDDLVNAGGFDIFFCSYYKVWWLFVYSKSYGEIYGKVFLTKPTQRQLRQFKKIAHRDG